MHDFIANPHPKRAKKAIRLSSLLEQHHSAPWYSKVRKTLDTLGMSGWGQQWKGNYWTGTRKSPKKRASKPAKGGGKKKDEAKEAMPGYDSALWSTSSPASSSAAPEPSVLELTRVLKSIVDAGQLSVPPEAALLLASQEKVELKEGMQREQRFLNAKRKAHNKVIRLQETLEGKRQKFQAYKQALKDQLIKETERFDQDVKSLKEAIVDAEAHLARLEKGETTEKDQPEMEIVDIEEMLEAEEGKEKANLQALLIHSQKEQQETEQKYTALHQQMVVMQQQYQALAHSLCGPHGSSTLRVNTSPVPSQEIGQSPQMPKPAAVTTLPDGARPLLSSSIPKNPRRAIHGEEIAVQDRDRPINQHGVDCERFVTLTQLVSEHELKQACWPKCASKLGGNYEWQQQDRSCYESSENSCGAFEQRPVYSSGSLERPFEADFVVLVRCLHELTPRRLGSTCRPEKCNSLTLHFVRKVRGCTQVFRRVVENTEVCGGLDGRGDHRELSTSKYCYEGDVFDKPKTDYRKITGICARNERGCTRYEGRCNSTYIKHRPDQWHQFSPRTWCFLMMISEIGVRYVWLLQMVLLIIARLCFLQYDQGHANIGTELSWQIVRGISWAVITFSYLCTNRVKQKKRLVTIQQRRYSLGVRPPPSRRLSYALMACMILNTHAVAVLQHSALSSNTTSIGSGYNNSMADRDPTLHADRWQDVHGNHLRIGCNRNEGRKIEVFGHHPIFGACGPRFGRANNQIGETLYTEACRIWNEIDGGIHCQAIVTKPQPKSTPPRTTMIARFDQGPRRGPIILADIELHGGMPRRHTILLGEKDTTSSIIRKADRDRRCFPVGIALCAIRHGPHLYYDHDEYIPADADYISIQEVPFESFSDTDIVSMQQTSLGVPLRPTVQGMRLTPEDIQDTCLLDEVVYDIPEDENEFMDHPPRHIWMNPMQSAAAIQRLIEQHQDRSKLDTYGLHDVHVGNRVTHVYNSNPTELLIVVRNLWAEFAIGSHSFIFEVVHQPRDSPPGTLVLLIEFPIPDRDHTYYRSTLLDVVVDGRALERTAVYLPKTCTVSDVAETVGREETCWPRGIDDCYVTHRTGHHDTVDRLDVMSGDYAILHIATLNARMALLQNVFPDAHRYARDFLWRTNHYSRDDYTVRIHATTNLLCEPRDLIRTRQNFRYADELWQETVDLWRTEGATDDSVLQVIWPQNIWQSDRQFLHMILVITPHISWYPILVSLLIRLGREPPRRIEVHSWQVPRVLTVQQLADLVGFSRFLNNHAEHVYVAYGSTIFDGQTATINIERGGHYEIYIQVATLNSFILAVARGTQQQNPSIVAEIAEDNEGDAVRDNSAGSSEDEDPALPQTPHLSSIDDDDTVMIQTFQHVKASMIGKNIGQVIFTSLLMLTDCSASYTDEFLDAVWPITIRGERELAAAADLDPDILRIRWLNIESRYGIPRPISIATLLILRPPTVRTPGEEFHITMARFDDPLLIPTEITDQWPDLRTSTWRLDQGHDFSRFIRTLDMVGSFFTLRQGREMAATNFVTGMVEIISRHNRDEHSRYFSAVLPQHTSWIHLWNWLRLGMGFQGGFNFEVWADGNQVIQPATPFDIAQGFFVQVIANAPTTGSLQVIPTSRFRSWSRELCFSLPSGLGPVYRAGTTIDRSEMARIPYRDRTEAILNRWPGLNVWTAYKVHPTGRQRGPPWSPMDDALLVQDQPDGINIAALCVVYEGTGFNDYGLILPRQCLVATIHQKLECTFRCQSNNYICTTTVNNVPAHQDEFLALDEGDYIEVLIFYIPSMSLQVPPMVCGRDAPDGNQSNEQLAQSMPSLLQTHLILTKPDHITPPVESDLGLASQTSSPSTSGVLFTLADSHDPSHTGRVPILLQINAEIKRLVGGDTDRPPTSTGQMLRQRKNAPPQHDPGEQQGQEGGDDPEEPFDDADDDGEGGDEGDDEEDITLRMFHRTTDFKTIMFTPGSPFDERKQIADGWGVEVDEIIGIHPLRGNPHDFDPDASSLVITRWAGDVNFRSYSTDVQCLFDIELHGGGTGRDIDYKLIRHVDWTRRTVTRDGILHYLQVSDYCRLIANDACLVWHNGDLWASQDIVARPTAFGDYFRVAVPISQGQTVSAARNLLRINENNARDHRIFESSPEDDDSTFEEMSEVSTSTSYGPRADVPEPEPHASLQKIGRSAHESCETKIETWGPIVLHGMGGNLCPHHTTSLTFAHCRCDACSRNDTALVNIRQWPLQNTIQYDSENRCRHDTVRRPVWFVEALLGGSCNGPWPPLLYTRSFNISRHYWLPSGNHPLWDVDAIFSKLRPPGNVAEAFHIGDDDDYTIDPPRVVDVRSHIDLNSLDDFCVSEQYIVITEYTERTRQFATLSESGVTDKLLHGLMEEWPSDTMDMAFGKLSNLHPLAQQFVEGACAFNWDEVTELQIYCDGSTYHCSDTNSDFAGCSMVVTATISKDDEPGYSIYGFTGGTLCTDPDSVHWWGANLVQAIEAERTGVLLSLLWILQSPFAVGTPCTIVFDCMAAGYGADGLWSYPIDSILAELLRGVSQLGTEYCPGMIKFAHTHAHVGDPANELADCLAKDFAKGTLPNYLANIDIAWLVNATKEHGSWLWLYFGAFARIEDLPPIIDNQVKLPEQRACKETHQNSSLESTAKAIDQKLLTLNLATMNVKSLYAGDTVTGEGSSYLPTKAQFLAQQLNWHAYDIVGIQESNSRQTGLAQVGSFVRIMGGSNDKGQLGCEIWLNRDRLRFQLQELCVLHSDHRRIFLRVQTRAIDLIIGSCHSPHSGAKEEERTDWWLKTKTLCHRYIVMAPLIILMDANSQVTQSIDQVSGTLLTGTPNTNEPFFLDLCRQCRLCLPATFTECHTSETGTWWHPSGQWLRIDYVVIPQSMLIQVTGSWVDTSVDMGAIRDDHRPCGCQIRLMLSAHRQEVQYGKYDWSRVDDPQVREQLRASIQQIPKIPWDTNVHVHAVQLRDAIHGTLSDVLGPEKPRRKLSYITDSTWATREGKKKLKKMLIERDAFMTSAWTLWAFESWKNDTRLVDIFRPHMTWLLRFDKATAHLRRLLIETARELRINLSQDRANFAKECAMNCKDKPLHQVFQAFRN